MTGKRRPSGDRRRATTRRRFAGDTRSVSVTVNYALNLMVASMLIAGVLAATGGMVEDRRESAARTELSVLGERVAAELMAADRLAVVGDGSNEAVAVTVSLPDRVASSRYEVSIATSPPEIVLRTDNPDVSVTVSFHHDTPIADATVRGGDFRVALNPDSDPDRLEVSQA